MFFGSDNTAPAAPEIMDALIAANHGYPASYGNDPLMDAVRDKIRTIFEAPEAAVYLVPTGTAANALALATICPPWATIYCHTNAHINEDECGAPEFYTGGAKLTLLGGADARIDPTELAQVLKHAATLGVHNVQRGALSISSVTEVGAVYTLDHLQALTALARQYDIPVHLDGARFANAMLALGCSPAEMSWKAGIDVLSLGGTKNGLIGAEAVIFFDPAKAYAFELRRKRAGHLFSKHRYLSAQMDAYLTDDLWLRLAGQANAQGQALARGLLALDGFKLLHPSDANMIFAAWPRRGHRALQAADARYNPWPFNHAPDGPDDEQLSARLVTSWSTTDADVAQFIAVLAGA